MAEEAGFTPSVAVTTVWYVFCASKSSSVEVRISPLWASIVNGIESEMLNLMLALGAVSASIALTVKTRTPAGKFSLTEPVNSSEVNIGRLSLMSSSVTVRVEVPVSAGVPPSIANTEKVYTALSSLFTLPNVLTRPSLSSMKGRELLISNDII